MLQNDINYLVNKYLDERLYSVWGGLSNVLWQNLLYLSSTIPAPRLFVYSPELSSSLLWHKR